LTNIASRKAASKRWNQKRGVLRGREAMGRKRAVAKKVWPEGKKLQRREGHAGKGKKSGQVDQRDYSKAR